MDFEKLEETFSFVKEKVTELLIYSSSTFALVGLNYNEQLSKKVIQFCDSYKIFFIPVEDPDSFNEDNYLLENLFGLFLTRKIKLIHKNNKSKQKFNKDDNYNDFDENINMCGFNSNYQMEAIQSSILKNGIGITVTGGQNNQGKANVGKLLRTYSGK